MRRCTAQVLVGNCSLCNGGVAPQYQIFLVEDETTTLMLKDLKEGNEWFWYPGKDSIVDDIFLMISGVILREVDLKDPKHLSLLEEYTEKERSDCYEMVREKSKKWDKKIVLNLFKNSLIENQLEHLNDYACNMEVTTTRYLKEKDGNGRSNESGHL